MRATTVPKAFADFEAKIRPTDTQKAAITARRTTTAKHLSDSFGKGTELELLSTRVIGSAGRETIIRPIDDIDLLAVFAPAAYEHYRNDSRAFLYRVRDALNNYNVQIVGARGQAVRLFYKEPPHVDIVPAIRQRTGGYLIPSGHKDMWWGYHKWLSTDPDHQATWMTNQNKKLDYHLKPLVRILKRWNREHGARLRSFHLEVMAAETFVELSSNRRTASQKFFEWGANNISVKDPAGHCGDLSSHMTSHARRELRSLMAISSNRAAKAITAEENGDTAEAIRLWRIIYGPEFPSGQ